MTIHLSSLGQVYLVCGKTDMRQGIDSLAYLVKTHFELDPFSGQVQTDLAQYRKGCQSSHT
ncbi:IS66 family insertion sequence element accessory protein TnpB [Streptococcus pneumoniae]|uniref:IS66 family insertion sequence element accessory protein TnpB n=1 Tax=Streptococcus pneumoniae TaxID=1313 RepID=UPI000A7E4D3E|nr:IS66 family insertion sequence element accessory protein TnpB [Streptococcus pneumoniae]